jgi:hypothetical protein
MTEQPKQPDEQPTEEEEPVQEPGEDISGPAMPEESVKEGVPSKTPASEAEASDSSATGAGPSGGA